MRDRGGFGHSFGSGFAECPFSLLESFQIDMSESLHSCAHSALPIAALLKSAIVLQVSSFSLLGDWDCGNTEHALIGNSTERFSLKLRLLSSLIKSVEVQSKSAVHLAS